MNNQHQNHRLRTKNSQSHWRDWKSYTGQTFTLHPAAVNTYTDQDVTYIGTRLQLTN